MVFGGHYDDGYYSFKSDSDSEPDYDYDLVLEDGRDFSHPDKYNYIELRSSTMKWKISVRGNRDELNFFCELKKGDRENPIETMWRALTFTIPNKIANNLRNVDWEKYPGLKEKDLCNGSCWRYPGSCGDSYCSEYLQQRAVLFVIK